MAARGEAPSEGLQAAGCPLQEICNPRFPKEVRSETKEDCRCKGYKGELSHDKSLLKRLLKRGLIHTLKPLTCVLSQEWTFNTFSPFLLFSVDLLCLDSLVCL